MRPAMRGSHTFIFFQRMWDYLDSWGRSGIQICTVHIENPEIPVYTDNDRRYRSLQTVSRLYCSHTLQREARSHFPPNIYADMFQLMTTDVITHESFIYITYITGYKSVIESSLFSKVENMVSVFRHPTLRVLKGAHYGKITRFAG